MALRSEIKIEIGGASVTVREVTVPDLPAVAEIARDFMRDAPEGTNPFDELFRFVGENAARVGEVLAPCCELPEGERLEDLGGAALVQVVSASLEVNAPFFAGLMGLMLTPLEKPGGSQKATAETTPTLSPPAPTGS